MKRVSIFELVEGVTYRAFNGTREFSKRYTLKKGKLYNSSGDLSGGGESDESGCEWIPMNANIEFEALGIVPKGAKAANALNKAKGSVSVLMLKEGIVYKAVKNQDADLDYISGNVTRTGSRLSYVDDKNKVTKVAEIYQIDLNAKFKPIGRVAGLKKRPATPKVKTKNLIAAKKAKGTGRSARA